MKKILIFGDSILKGVVLGEDNRYRIQHSNEYLSLEKDYDLTIKNYSKMGCAIMKGQEIVQRVLGTQDAKADYAIVEYGGNDSDFDWREVAEDGLDTHLPNTSIVDFESTLKDILTTILSQGIKPILMTLPPIDAEKYFNNILKNAPSEENLMKFLGEVSVIYRFQELYSMTVLKVAKDMALPIVDVRRKFLKHFDIKSFLCEDGIHPNALGQKIILQAFIEYFEKEERLKKVA